MDGYHASTRPNSTRPSASPVGGAAEGAPGGASQRVHHRAGGHGQDAGVAHTLQDDAEHEEEARVLRLEPEGCDDGRALRLHQPRNQGVEGR